MKRAMLIMALVAGAANAQPKLPETQQRFCAILDNWQFRGGYAKGAEPKIDPNPIKAAQAPKPPDPGNLFDQLVEVFGTPGTVTNWKGTVGFDVLEYDKVVSVSLKPYCPEPAKAGSETWLWFETDRAHYLPLKSPLAQFLGGVENFSKVTFSARLFYVPALRFYRESTMDPRGRRNLGAGQFFVMRNSFVIEVTDIAK
jgi:hypothetical protein